MGKNRLSFRKNWFIVLYVPRRGYMLVFCLNVS